jgi:membrane protease YdiL (CAAX protease family)
MTEPRRPLIASLRHTAILIAIVLGVAAYGIYAQAASHEGGRSLEHRGSALPLYLSLLAAEWGLVRYATIGIHRTGTSLRDLIRARWAGPKDALRDVALGLGSWAAWTAISSPLAQLLGPDSAPSLDPLLPRNLPESAVWILLSLSAGICEEVVFRGYFQRQFEALWGSAALAIAAQAVIFGVSHGYQGLRNVVVITVYGTLFGILAHWRRSLVPGMAAHAWTDIAAGLIFRR